ncbi:MAG TPA: ABC transporter permease [Nitrolancea sp.]|nr:ABC transporter permease [Nitrolancea sp.]
MIELNADSVATSFADELEADTGRFRQGWGRFQQNRVALIGGIVTVIVILMAIAAPLISIHNPDATDPYHSLTPPSLTHPFGTDNVGRDVLSRVIFGARVSIEVGLFSVLVGILIGVPLGAVAGYWSGSFLDELIMRIFDVFIAFPTMILAIAVMGVLGVKPTVIGPIHIDSIAKIVIVTGVVFAPPFARVIRSSFLQEREEQYVQAARSIGEGNARIIFSEILPNSIVPIIVQATYFMATAILIEASLSFLGVGIRPPMASWGSMLSDARGYIISGEWWFSVFPGLAILLTMAGLNLLGDGLRDALDPRTRDVGV